MGAQYVDAMERRKSEKRKLNTEERTGKEVVFTETLGSPPGRKNHDEL